MTIPKDETLTFWWVVDTSGSMSGSRISRANAGIQEAADELRRIQADFQCSLKMGVLTFDEIMCIVCLPISVDDFTEEPLSIRYKDNGFLPFGSYRCLYNGLYDVFTRDSINTSRGATYVCLVTDGHPADANQYQEAARRCLTGTRLNDAQRYVMLVCGNEDQEEAWDFVREFVDNDHDHVMSIENHSSLMTQVRMSVRNTHGFEEIPRDMFSKEYQFE